jgi:hypothetical protein
VATKQAMDYLSEMSDEELACRAAHRHLFWSDEVALAAARALPRQVRVAKQKGVFQVEEECLRGCGRLRCWTSRRGMFGPDTVYAYRTRAGVRRVVIPDTAPGHRPTPRDCKAEAFERANEGGSLEALFEAAAQGAA